jgi:hypothetical protein
MRVSSRTRRKDIRRMVKPNNPDHQAAVAMWACVAETPANNKVAHIILDGGSDMYVSALWLPKVRVFVSADVFAGTKEELQAKFDQWMIKHGPDVDELLSSTRTPA